MQESRSFQANRQSHNWDTENETLLLGLLCSEARLLSQSHLSTRTTSCDNSSGNVSEGNTSLNSTDYNETFDALIARCVTRGWARPSDIGGCTEEEIQLVADRQGVPLPPAYQAFLSRMGRRAGALMGGSDVFYSWPLGMREGALELLAENGDPFVLPDDALVFWMHQGYQFMFMCASEGDDPPVYYYMEGTEVAIREHEHFTDFLSSQIGHLSDDEVAHYYKFLSALKRDGHVTL